MIQKKSEHLRGNNIEDCFKIYLLKFVSRGSKTKHDGQTGRQIRDRTERKTRRRAEKKEARKHTHIHIQPFLHLSLMIAPAPHLNNNRTISELPRRAAHIKVEALSSMQVVKTSAPRDNSL